MLVTALIGLVIYGIFELGRRKGIALLRRTAWVLLLLYGIFAAYGIYVLFELGASNGVIGQAAVGPAVLLTVLTMTFVKRRGSES